MEVPYATPPQTPIVPHAGRFSSTVKPIGEYQPDPDGKRAVAILGMPDDTGVKMNNGRPGAKEGPGAIRRSLARMGVAKPALFDWPTVYDAGDVLPAGDDLDETHRRVSEASAEIARAGIIPIGLGGGHDLTFPFVRGVLSTLDEELRPFKGVYLDAHLDVRETKGSGMPFRKLIEECHVGDLTVAGLDLTANTDEHYQWFQANGGGMAPPEEVFSGRRHFASLDMDAIDVAHAPGVSAQNACGLSPRQAECFAYDVALFGMGLCFDIMELSPPHDTDDRTARLAARLCLAYLHGIGMRTEKFWS